MHRMRYYAETAFGCDEAATAAKSRDEGELGAGTLFSCDGVAGASEAGASAAGASAFSLESSVN